MGIIINILLSLFTGGILVLLAYLLLLKIKGEFINVVHIIALVLLLIFVSVQAYLFFSAMDLKDSLIESANEINEIASASTEMLSQFDEGENLTDDFKSTISTIDLNPLIRLFGYSLGEDGLEVSRHRIDSINSYMTHRCLWAFAALTIYIIITVLIPTNTNMSRRPSGEYGRKGIRDNSYRRRSGHRGRRSAR